MPRPKREIPWLDKRGDIFYVFWYDPGKRVTRKQSLETRCPTSAQNRYIEFLTGGSPSAKDNGPITVSKALEYYLAEHIRKYAVDKRNTEIRANHIKNYFKDKQLRDIDIPECRMYLEERMSGRLSKKPAKASTAAQELYVLQAAANHALRWRRITQAEMPTFEMPQTPVSRGVWLFEDELQLLMEAAAALKNESFQYRTLSFIELTYYTGSRCRAIETLTWPQVDLTRGRIALAKDGERKTNKRRPTIAIDPKLLPALERCKRQKRNDLVLGTEKKAVYGMLAAARKVGLENLPAREGRPAAHLSPHVLRHSRATHLLQKGVNPWAVANLLGDNLITVTKVYGHHSPMHLEELFKSNVVTPPTLAISSPVL